MNKMKTGMKKFCVAILTVLLSASGFSAFAADDAPRWVGPDDIEIHYGDVTNYVSGDSTYSAEVPADGVAWICYSNASDRFWIGIENADGVFEEGSRFHVRWSADDSSGREGSGIIPGRDNRRGNDLSVLEMGVESPDGTEYRALGRKVSLYLQPADCVDDLMAFSVYDDASHDEIIEKSMVRRRTPDGAETTLIDIRLTHPDAQLLFSWKTALGASMFSKHEPLILCLGAIAVLAVVTVTLVSRKKKRTSRTGR